MIQCHKCGKEFAPSRPSNIYCSDKCRTSLSSARYYHAHKEKCLTKDKRRYQRLISGSNTILVERAACAICGKSFIKNSTIQKMCSEACRIKYRSIYARAYYSNYPRAYNHSGSSVFKFYSENPYSIYMPKRQKMVDASAARHGFGEAICKGCGSKFLRRKTPMELYCGECPPYKSADITLRQAVALANAKFYIGDDRVEKIDLETLSGLPSEHKDAIIKALFEALKAKKTLDAKPKERKMTQKGMFFTEVDRLEKGEYIPLLTLIERSGTSKHQYMKAMNIFRALKEMPDGVLGIQACKLDNFPSGWLEKNLYGKRGWHNKNKQV